MFAHFLSYLPVDFLSLVFADFLRSNTLSTGISFQVFPITTGRHLIFTTCHKVRESLALTLKKNYGTHVIKLDIAPKTYPLGQHLFISASNNMFYRHSQWDKRHTICVVNLMPQDTIIVFLDRSCLGSNLHSSGWVSDTLPMCHIGLVEILWNWIYLELNIFPVFILPTPFPISRAELTKACLLILHSKKFPQRMLSSWVLHRRHIQRAIQVL